MHAKLLSLAVLTAFISATTAQNKDQDNYHTSGYCCDEKLGNCKGFLPCPEDSENNAATRAACVEYQKSTGPNTWDSCPDCTVGISGDVATCNSASKRLAGDQWNTHCKNNGARGGSV